MRLGTWTCVPLETGEAPHEHGAAAAVHRRARARAPGRAGAAWETRSSPSLTTPWAPRLAPARTGSPWLAPARPGSAPAAPSTRAPLLLCSGAHFISPVAP
eukprot:7042520-Prymnesium_polylepis.1